MSSDQSKSESNFEDDLHPAIYAGAAVASLTIPFVGPFMSVMFAKGAITSASKRGGGNNLPNEEPTISDSFREFIKDIDKLIDEKKLSLNKLDQALIHLKKENPETIDGLNLEIDIYKKFWWGLIYLSYEDSKKFSSRQIAWFLNEIYEKHKNQKYQYANYPIYEVLLENYLHECLEYRQSDFKEFGFNNESLKKIDIFLKEFLLTKKLSIGINFNHIYKEFFLHFLLYLNELEPHIEINSYLQKDFFIHEKFAVILNEWIEFYYSEEASKQDNINYFLNTNLDKYLSKEWEKLKNKNKKNDNNQTLTNENINSNFYDRARRLYEERNALINRIRDIIKNKKNNRFKKNIGSLYSQIQNLDKEIAFINTKIYGNIDTLDKFNHVRSNFQIEYEKYLDDLQKKIAFEQEQKKLKAHQINIERQKLELKQRKKIEFKKKIKVRLANEIEKNFKIDYMFKRFKEIDNLMKTKVYNNKQSKKITEVIEESYRSRLNEFLLDDKMMPIHEDVAIKISNLINECSTGELKEFIPFEKVDNFFNYKNEVFNNYYIWRKELIRFNKRKEIKYQVTHDVQVNDQRDDDVKT